MLTFGRPPHSRSTSMSTRSRSEPRVEEASTGRRLSPNHRIHPQDDAKEHQWQLEDKWRERPDAGPGQASNCGSWISMLHPTAR